MKLILLLFPVLAFAQTKVSPLSSVEYHMLIKKKEAACLAYEELVQNPDSGIKIKADALNKKIKAQEEVVKNLSDDPQQGMTVEDRRYCIDGCKRPLKHYNNQLPKGAKKIDPMNGVDKYEEVMDERNGKTKRKKMDDMRLFVYRGGVGTCTAIAKQAPDYETVLDAKDVEAVNKCKYVSNLKRLPEIARTEHEKLDALRAEKDALYLPVTAAERACDEAEQEIREFLTAHNVTGSVIQENSIKNVPSNAMPGSNPASGTNAVKAQ